MKKCALTFVLCVLIPAAVFSEQAKQNAVPANTEPVQQTVQEIKSPIPLGTWTYTVFINKKKTGNAVISCVRKDGQYISTATITVQTGSTVVISKDTVVETTEFVPVSHETITTIVQNEKVERTKTVVAFKGHEVYITTGDGSAKATVNGDFVISDNFFTAKMSAAGYAAGTTVKGFLYDHTFDLENPVAVSVKVTGLSAIQVAKKKQTFTRIVETVGAIKDIETLIDGSGVAYKITMKLMNTTLEMVRN